MSSITFRMKTATMHAKLLDFTGISALMLILSRRALMVVSLLALLLQLMSSPLLAAELMIDDGVMIKFGVDAQLAVRDHLVAGKGIIMTSQRDDRTSGQLGLTRQSPQLGDWLGIRLEKSAAGFGALTLNDLTLRYGGATVAGGTSAALTIRGWSPVLQNLLVSDNGIGLRVLDGAASAISGSSFLRNNTGIASDNNSEPSITSSQLVGNTVLAIDNKTPSTIITATGNWWGHPTGPKEPTANPGGQGNPISTGIDFGSFTAAPPLLNPSVRLAAPATYFDRHDVLLDLACVNATEYRIAEGDIFTKATFQPLTDNRAQVAFTTSASDGRKQISVEFRDTDGTVATASLEGGVLIDSQAPSLTLTNPANGSVISQPITIDATASDESGIAKVEFFIDDQRVAGITAAPFSYNWNTNNSTDGDHSIRVVATDIAGRISEQTATVTLSHSAPVADTQGPQLTNVSANGDLVTDGMTLARSTTISFSVSDPSGVAHIELLLDGSVVTSPSGNGSYSAILNLDNVPRGPHTLTLRATDSLANVSILSYTINVAHTPPAAPVLSQPVSGFSSFTATIAVSGTAQPESDVQLFVNAKSAGPVIVAGSDGHFATSVTLTTGSNQIQATATDQYGTSPASAVVLVTLDQTIPSSPGSLTATAQAAGKEGYVWDGLARPILTPWVMTSTVPQRRLIQSLKPPR